MIEPRPRAGALARNAGRLWCLAAAIAGLVAGPQAALGVKIVTYNLLNYAGTAACDTEREPYYRTIFNAINAQGEVDIICVEEVESDSVGMNNFLNNVLNHAAGPGGFTAAPFLNGHGGGGDNAMYYRANKVQVLASQSIRTDIYGGIRDWTYHQVRLAGYSTTAADLHIFIAHLSSSGGAAQREIEADVYRDWAEANLPAGAHIVCNGDFNLESSAEGAWTMFTETRATNIGRLRDPAGRVGAWSDNSSFADVHTQAPQLSQSQPCTSCGYSGGGMDDRFDFLLTSDPLHDAVYPFPGDMEYYGGRYKAFGNDGLHYNKSINASPVIPEGQDVADALACSADHLPVVIEILAPSLIPFIPAIDFGQSLVSTDVQRTLTVENTAPPPAQVLRYTMVYPTAYTGPTGPFSEMAGGGSNAHTITRNSPTSGNKFATLRICNNSPDAPTCPECPGQGCRTVALLGSVLDHAVPSTQSGSQVLTADLDFGVHPAGGFVDQTASVYNAGYHTYQSYLDVFDAQVTGDPRFSVDFAPATVTGTPAQFAVAFDDAGASPGVYTATLVFSTRDNMSLPGAMILGSPTFNLTATPAIKGDMDMNGAVETADIPSFVAVLLDPDGATQAARFIADVSDDQINDAEDIQPFVDMLVP